MILDYPLLWLTLLLPPAISLALPPRLGARAAYLVGASLLAPLAITGYYYLEGGLGEGVFDPVAVDLSGVGLGSFRLFIDGISGPVVIGVSLVTSLVAVYSVKYMEHRIEEMRGRGESVPGLWAYLILYSLFSASMLGMAYSSNLVLFFFFLEASLLASFMLILYYGYGDRRRIALLYFVWTHIGGGLFLVGALAYGVASGTLDVVVPSDGAVSYLEPAAESRLAASLMLLGLLVKMAVIGVHMWLPYAHAEAPTPVSALLSPNLVGLGGYAIARFMIPLFPGFMAEASDFLVLLAFSTIVYGGLVALRQNDFKRFLAYSSISQMGYILLGIATLTGFGVAGAMLHYLAHAVGKAVLFMVAGVFIAEMGGLRRINDMGGLARRYPLVTALAMIGFLHLAGIPPSFGLWGELLVLLGFVEYWGYSRGVIIPAAAVILAFGVTAGYSFIAARRIFFGPPRHGGSAEESDAFKASILVVALAGLALFVLAGPLLGEARESVEVLLGGE